MCLEYEEMNIKEKLPDKKPPRSEFEVLESGSKLEIIKFLPFLLHDIGITHEVIPRLENRRLKTNENEDDKKHRDNEEVRLETEGEQFIDIEQIKKFDEE